MNEIFEYELAGVVKYTHFALMVTGPNRLMLDKFFKSQATESLATCSASRRVVDWIRWTSNSGIPTIKETNQHSVKNLLTESLHHEENAILLYNQLLESSEGKSLYIEEYAREMIKTEEMHSIEIKKLLRDYDQ